MITTMAAYLLKEGMIINRDKQFWEITHIEHLGTYVRINGPSYNIELPRETLIQVTNA